MGLPFPEGLTAKPTDTTMRAMQKSAQRLFDLVGNVNCSFYPEGSQPLATDDVHRLSVKINAMVNALT